MLPGSSTSLIIAISRQCTLSMCRSLFSKGANLLFNSVEWIGDFCDPNLVQYFHCVIQSDSNPVVISKYLIQSGLYPEKNSD